MTLKYYNDYITSYQEYGGFDVKLVAENQTIHTHRLILSAGSKFLRKLLKSVDHQDDGGPAVIVLDAFSFEEVYNFVMTLYNTTDLKSPSQVPKIFHDLRFSHIGNKISADDDDSESADEEIGSSPDQTIEPDVKLIMEDDIKKEICFETIRPEFLFNQLNPHAGNKENIQFEGENLDNLCGSGGGVKRKKDENKYQCTECTFKTCRPGRLRTHMETKHQNSQVEPGMLTELEGLEDWKLSLLRGLPFGLDEEADDGSQDSFERPAKKKKSLTRKCEECDYVTDHGPNRLRLHIQRNHRAPNPAFRPFKCDLCKYATDEAYDLKRHKRNKHGVAIETNKSRSSGSTSGSLDGARVAKLECDMCDYAGDQLIQHRETEHKVFEHEIIMTDKKARPKKDPASLKCDQCDYACDRPNKLRNHMKMNHLGGYTEEDKWYSCPYDNCDKKYRTPGPLSTHINGNHKGRLFYCDKCSYSSKFKASLDLHYMKHHAGARFICEQCGHEAANPKQLKYHIQIVHEGKTYPCGQCDFVGETYSKTAHHQRRNHSTSTYICDECSMTFVEKGGLSSHKKKVHTSVKYHCGLCDFSTKVEYSMRRHRENKHKEDPHNVPEDERGPGGGGHMVAAAEI